MSFISQCADCKHFHGKQPGWKCGAFPQRIPAEIIKNQHDHTQPYPGDKGIQFEPVEAEGDESA